MSEKAAARGHPRSGVSLCGYQSLPGKTMTLDDAFEEMHNMGSTFFAFLTSYIEGYPNPPPKQLHCIRRIFGRSIGQIFIQTEII